jgi:pyruvate dehydrogenase E1 component beta subunit
LGAEISALIMEKVLLDLKAPVERVTGFDTVMPLYRLEAEYLPDSFRIIQGVKKVMSF